MIGLRSGVPREVIRDHTLPGPVIFPMVTAMERYGRRGGGGRGGGDHLERRAARRRRAINAIAAAPLMYPSRQERRRAGSARLVTEAGHDLVHGRDARHGSVPSGVSRAVSSESRTVSQRSGITPAGRFSGISSDSAPEDTAETWL